MPQQRSQREGKTKARLALASRRIYTSVPHRVDLKPHAREDSKAWTTMFFKSSYDFTFIINAHIQIFGVVSSFLNGILLLKPMLDTFRAC